MVDSTQSESARAPLTGAPPARVVRIAQMLRDRADPLSARLCGARIGELAGRLAGVVPTSFDGTEDGPEASAAIASALPRTLSLLGEELATATRALDELLALLARLPDPASRTMALFEHLGRTIEDPRARRADQEALGRHLGSDTLIERHARRRARHGMFVDLAMQFLRVCADELRDAPTGVRRAAGLQPEGISDALRGALWMGLESPRWQTVVGAVRATLRLLPAPARGDVEASAPDGLIGRIVRRAEDPEEHVAVVTEALMVAPFLPLDARLGFLERLTRTGLDQHPSDRALVRARAIDLWLATANTATRRAMLVSLHRSRDPSEHVRMQLFTTAVRHGESAILRALFRGSGWEFEASPRVRAVALRAAIARHHETDLFDEVLGHVFGVELEPLVLEVAVDACAAVVEAHPEDPGVAARLASLLCSLRARAELPPGVQEVVSAVLERIDTARDPIRHAVTQALRTLVGGVAPGRTVELRLDALPAFARARAADPAWMVRVFAEVSRDAHGLDARPVPGGYLITRGDRFATRAWRLAHEVRHRAPNKRQAFTHTVGRTLRGTLRAHPGGMDEVTATTVPGERVSVDGQGGWGRHLPTVDDLLDLPWARAEPVRLASSHGTTTLTPPASAPQRLRNRLRLAWAYGRFAALRLASMRGTEPYERRAYVSTVQQELGIRVEFAPHPLEDLGPQPTPAHVASLLDVRPPAALALPSLGMALEFLREQAPYLLSPTGNSQSALAVFAGGLLGTAMVRSHVARRRIRAARAKIPMTIGGWGTRGKSGTERIKTGLFHGLGFQVLVKTTGCEAMFIHSVPGQRPLEVFIYRPYDKATIWEQAKLLEFAARLETEVFLWECMALNPRYVDVLAHEWMHDDLTTLTNAFPNHEDIQGPAGQNVAEVISRFIPRGGLCFTSEVNFLPLFEEQARTQGTKLVPVRAHEADLLPADLLAAFPYQEHPRNIALVLRMAEHFGIDRGLAMALMAEHVVPDLGVLKTYPTVRLWGRMLRFMNGMSANERTGCVSNWRRMGLDAIDPDAEPGEVLVTVVNNRDDRVARSEVFGRILVEDLAADRHVLIGTNLGGLEGYVDAALARMLPTLEVLSADGELGAASPRERLARTLKRLRVPAPSVEVALARLERFALGARHRLVDRPRAGQALERWISPEARGSTGLASVRAELAADAALRATLDGCLVEDDAPAEDVHPELWEPATKAEVLEHFLDSLARIVVHARLRPALPTERGVAARDAYHAALRAAYAELLRASLVVVNDPKATGDQIIARIARATPPGTRVTIMGIQNIKGTGLDFAYRWVALGRVEAALDDLTRDSAVRRERGFSELESLGDHGLLDAGLARVRLQALDAVLRVQTERDRARALLVRIEDVWNERCARLASTGRSGGVFHALRRGVQRSVDHLDSIRRARESQQVLEDLIHARISVARAATVLRDLTARQKAR